MPLTCDLLTSPDAVALLAAIDRGDLNCLPILADLLEEAGDGRSQALRAIRARPACRYVEPHCATWGWHPFLHGTEAESPYAGYVDPGAFSRLRNNVHPGLPDMRVYPSPSAAYLALAEALRRAVPTPPQGAADQPRRSADPGGRVRQWLPPRHRRHPGASWVWVEDFYPPTSWVGLSPGKGRRRIAGRVDPMEVMTCCLCNSKAVAVFDLPGGCVARPDLTRQPLCHCHAAKSRPLDGMTLVEDLTVGGAFGRWWTGEG